MLAEQVEAKCEKGLSTFIVDNPVEKCVEPGFPLRSQSLVRRVDMLGGEKLIDA